MSASRMAERICSLFIAPVEDRKEDRLVEVSSVSRHKVGVVCGQRSSTCQRAHCACALEYHSRKSPFFVVPLPSKQAKKLWLLFWTVFVPHSYHRWAKIGRDRISIAALSFIAPNFGNRTAPLGRFRRHRHFTKKQLPSAIFSPLVPPTFW